MNNKGLAILLVLSMSTIAVVTGLFLLAPKTHFPLYEEIYEIKDRLLINITDPSFPSTGIRECDGMS